MIKSKGKKGNGLVWLVGIVLATVTFACYWPASRFDYIGLDDGLYAYKNAMVQRGISWPGLTWAFKSVQGGNWNPLVWLSLMADCQVFGLAAGGHHLTNILLHTVNTLLVFLVFRRMTGALWRSALVAAIFAWHPLHVESVAWISERKDVLSTLFWLLTMWAYACHASKTKSPGTRRATFYGLALVCFFLGLMSKPMLVTLPVILLLLDYWPLRRAESLGKLLLEKIPFAILSLGACVLTILAQRKAAGAQSAVLRVENAVVSYVTYAGELFWPVKLAVFYPYPHEIAAWLAGAALLTLAAVTGAVLWRMSERRYLATGWFWFLITLLPVIGLLQVGMQARADRYTYVPYLGLALMLSWGLGDLVQRWPSLRLGVAVLTVGTLGCCLAVTARQLQYWQNSASVFEHALEVTSGNYVAHSNLGYVFTEEGKLDQAEKEFLDVIQLVPGMGNAYNDLGKTYALQNKADEAFAMFSKAIKLSPDLPEAQWNYGNALVLRGQTTEGLAEMEKSVRQRPDEVEEKGKFAEVLFRVGKGAEAVPYCEAVAREQPEDAHAQFMLGAAYIAQKRFSEAAASFTKAVQLAPDNPQCLNALAWIYATGSPASVRNGPEAMRLAEKTCAITKRQNTAHLDTLAAAYAQAGRFEDAIRTAGEMLALANSLHDNEAAKTASSRLELYKAGQPCCGSP